MLICSIVGCLAGAPAQGLARPGPAQVVAEAQAQDAALRGAPEKLKFRHHIERVLHQWGRAVRAAEADPALLLEARRGEAEAWALMAHWSGRADDLRQAQALQAALRAPTASTPTPEVAAVQVVEVEGGLRVELGLDAAATQVRRRALPAQPGRRARVYFDLSPAQLAAPVVGAVALKHPGVASARLGQFDADTARLVLELETLDPEAVQADGAAVVVRVPAADAPLAASHEPSVTVGEASAAAVGERPALGRAEALGLELAALSALVAKAEGSGASPEVEAASPAPAEGLAVAAPGVQEAPAGSPAPAALPPATADEATPRVPAEAPSAGPAGPEVQPTSEQLARAVAEAAAPDATLEVVGPLRRSTREAAQPRATSLLSIRKVVIDAGHGGKDEGAVGPGGVKEKDVNLAIARRVGAALEARLGVEVVYTRTDDRFISLEQRARIANKHRADLFVSVHANAHRKHRVHGIETYYLNTTSSRYARKLARRENLLSKDGVDGPEPDEVVEEDDDAEASLPEGELGQDVKLILADLAMRSASLESRRLAGYVQSSMVGRLRRDYEDVKDLGVKHALFYVLLGVRMPAVLIETGFVSHAEESKRLADAAYQDRLARAIVQGVSRFAEERAELADRLGPAPQAERLAAN